jgi:chromosome segregation ATPase
MRSPIVTGLRHPLNVLMLALAVLAGLLAAWWLFFVGLVLWLVMVMAVSRDPSLQISHRMQSRTPLAQRFQHYFDRIERAQVSVFNSLASAPSQTRRALEPVQEELEALTGQVHALCQRMTALENYRIVSESTSNLQSDLTKIDEVLAKAGDPLVRQEYEESRQVLLERIAKLKIVSSELERVEAQLLGLATEMDGLVTEVLRLQAAGAEEAARKAPALVERLHTEAEELQEFERQVVAI